MSYGSQDAVYPLAGITSTEVDATFVKRFLEDADEEIDLLLKTTCRPRIVIEKFWGNNTSEMVVKKVPLLAVMSLEIQSESVSTDTLFVKDTGEIDLTDDSEVSYFYPEENMNVIKYLYGNLEEDKSVLQETLSVAFSKGATKVITVTDITNYPIGSYVKIEGMDGCYEVTPITAITSTPTKTITVTMYQDHEAGSIVTKMITPKIVVDLANTLAAIKVASYMLGNASTKAVSYSLPDYSLTKTNPSEVFAKSLAQNISQRDYLLTKLSPFPSFA